MKKTFITILFFITTFILMGCEKKETRNLPVFNEGSHINEIEFKLKKKKIDFMFLEVLTNKSEKDGFFVEYGNSILKNKKEIAIPGSLIPEGMTIEVKVYVYSPIIISKYLHDYTGNYAIELYNLTANHIDLSEYNLTFFPKGEKKVKVKNQIKLEGTIKGKDIFQISLSSAKDEDLENLDQTIDKDEIGDERFAITNKNNFIIDFFGSDGMPEVVFGNRLLVRKKRVDVGSLTYNLLEWTNYVKEAIDIFADKIHPKDEPKEFRLAQKWKDTPFSQKGGTIKVKFISNNDGDTAQFENIDPDQPDYNFTGDHRVRFVGVDTPEMTQVINGVRQNTKGKERRNAQAATDYVKNMLKNAKKIYLQHDMTTGNRDTYGRHLALIWIDDVLLNYLIVKEGHSQNLYSASSQKFVYEEIELREWFQMAQDEAKKEEKGIWA